MGLNQIDNHLAENPCIMTKNSGLRSIISWGLKLASVTWHSVSIIELPQLFFICSDIRYIHNLLMLWLNFPRKCLCAYTATFSQYLSLSLSCIELN